MSTKIIRYFAFPVHSVFLVQENDYKVQCFPFPTFTKCLYLRNCAYLTHVCKAKMCLRGVVGRFFGKVLNKYIAEK